MAELQQTVAPAAMLEALRRRSQQTGSSTAIGADNANSLSASNPIAKGGTGQMTSPNLPQGSSGGSQGFPTDGAQAQLKQEKSESQMILDTMGKRLKVLGERGE